MITRLSTSYFFFTDTATTEIYTLSLHDALPICAQHGPDPGDDLHQRRAPPALRPLPRADDHHRGHRSEEHTSELQSQFHLVCRLLLEKKKKKPPTTSRQKSNKRLYESCRPTHTD